MPVKMTFSEGKECQHGCLNIARVYRGEWEEDDDNSSYHKEEYNPTIIIMSDTTAQGLLSRLSSGQLKHLSHLSLELKWGLLPQDLLPQDSYFLHDLILLATTNSRVMSNKRCYYPSQAYLPHITTHPRVPLHCLD